MVKQELFCLDISDNSSIKMRVMLLMMK